MSDNIYESEKSLAEYLLFHYGKPEDVLPYSFGPANATDFHLRCVRLLVQTVPLTPNATGLDLGCAVGRASFELARYCTKVVGVDSSEKFIATARVLKEKGALEFKKISEGNLGVGITARTPEGVERSRVEFITADAQHLPGNLGPFDAVLMLNLIDRLKDPETCLKNLRTLIKPKGGLLIASPYTWLKEFTPENKWLGGFSSQNRPVRAIETLQNILLPDFELLSSRDMPFLIREHERKYQWSVAQATVWKKK